MRRSIVSLVLAPALLLSLACADTDPVEESAGGGGQTTSGGAAGTMAWIVVYWSAVAAACALLASVWWVRGVEGRPRDRATGALRQLHSASGWLLVASVALAAIAGAAAGSR